MSLLSSLRYLVSIPLKVLTVLFVSQMPGMALPQGGQVTQGAATIQQESANKLNINQSTDRAVINWNSFSIGVPDWVNFQQPSSTSATLNRVTGATPSSIAGKLTANGQIFLINPNGIMFLPTAQVDVAGLVASTLNIQDSDFMRNILRFEQMPGKAPASVVNQGLITVKEAGFAALVAPAVQNSGIISARLGKVVLASGTTVSLDFYGDGLVSVTVDPKLAGQITDIYGNKLNSLIDNQGNITAPGGIVTLTAQAAGQIVDSVINVGGVIQAKHAENRNGVIVLSGGSKGTVAVNGTLDVSGEQGGKVQITGENVGLFGQAKIDASGDKAGGLVFVGGDYLGGRADKQRIDSSLNAQNTFVGRDSILNADAKISGNAGEVIVWADNFTRFDGTISAVGDNGGFVETSGRNILEVGNSAQVNTTGRTGKTGTWLLDPFNITINAAGPDTKVTGSSPFTPTGTGSVIKNATINNALLSNNVVVKTVGTVGPDRGDVIFASDALVTWDTANTFTVQAAGQILMNPGSKVVSTNTGSFDAIVFEGNISGTTGGNFAGIKLDGATTLLQTAGGNITLTGKGGNTGTDSFGILQQNGAQVSTVSGNITYEGTGGSGTFANFGVLLEDTNTKVSSTAGGNISITGTGGSIGFNSSGISQQLGAQVSTTTGDITYQGTGGSGTFDDFGVLLQDPGTTISSTAGGNISITGTGGGTGGNNSGILQRNGAQVSTTTGDITYQGTGGSGFNSNFGVLLEDTNTKVSSTAGGNISITGTGGGQGFNNSGIHQQLGAQVSTTTGDITYEGTGGTGTSNNLGVFLQNTGTIIESDSGAINITGTGQGTVINNHGIFQQDGAQVSTTTGDITYQGTGGNGIDSNIGVLLQNTGTIIESDSGAINITGTGQGTVINNHGISQQLGAQVSTTTGNITYKGTGGSGVNSNFGVFLQNTGTKIKSDSGAINITGTGQGTVINNHGIFQQDGAQVSTTTGNITYKGTGGKGTGLNFGVLLASTGTRISSDSGAISITGTGKGTGVFNYGILQQFDAQVSTTTGNISYEGTGAAGSDAIRTELGTNKIGNNTSGNITLTGDRMTLNNVEIQAKGNLLIQPLTKTETIGIGTSSIGILNLDNTELGNIKDGFSLITIGRNDGSGAIDVKAFTFTDNLKIQNPGGAGIKINGALSFGTNNLTLASGGAVTQTQAITASGLELLGGGAFTLTNATNNISTLAANTTNTISYTDANSFTVGTVNTDGITSKGDTTLTALGEGTITVIENITNTATALSNLNIKAEGNIIFNNGADVVPGTGALNVTLNSDTNSINGGAIQLNKGTTITSNGGNIILGGGSDPTKNPAQGNSTLKTGIELNGANLIAGAGNITLTGTGNNSGVFNFGIYQFDGAQVSTTTGNITYAGVGGKGTDANFGVILQNTGTKINSTDGAIKITGVGDGTKTNNYGIYQLGGAEVNTTTGDITYTGVGGKGTDANFGVVLQNSGTKIGSSNGAIKITGIGEGTGNFNYGIYQLDGSQVATTKGAITYTGVGGKGTDVNFGVVLQNSGTKIGSGDGAINITGIGQGTGSFNFGIYHLAGAQVTTTKGAITYTGVGGKGTDANFGVALQDSGTLVGSSTGAITITGIGQGIGSFNLGIFQAGGAQVFSTGKITFQGQGAGGAKDVLIIP